MMQLLVQKRRLGRVTLHDLPAGADMPRLYALSGWKD
jgi:hypothetical protein